MTVGLPIPKKLGRYELVEPLGQGGMGEVWLARLSGAGGFEKPAIVKTVLPAIAQDPQFVQRFHHEGKVLVHLSHSNIAQVYDLDTADGVLFMALEYVAGVDLSRLVTQVYTADELVPVPVAVFFAWQAAEGLAYAHTKAAPDGTPLAIVHRDVSPQNIMVSFEGEVKVIDFGIARSAARSHSTQNAMVMGKLGYMAPEQAAATAVDARADQYALAVLLWELLAGRHYVAAGTTPEMMIAMAQPKRQPLMPFRQEVDAALDAVVQKALSPKPDDRYPTTEDFARALLGELNRLGQPTRKQVGEWVKVKCSAAYENNQRLLSRLSTFNQVTEPVADGLAKTVASRGVEVKDNPSAAASTNEVMAAARPSRMPIFVAAGVMLVALMTGIALMKGKDEAVPPPVAEAPKPPPPTVEPTPAPKPPEPTAVVVPPTAAIVEAAAPDAGAAVAPAPKPSGKARLNVTLALVSLPKRAVRLANLGKQTLTKCTVYIPGQRANGFKSLPGGMSREIGLELFNDDPTAPNLGNEVQMVCAQGSITLPAE